MKWLGGTIKRIIAISKHINPIMSMSFVLWILYNNVVREDNFFFLMTNSLYILHAPMNTYRFK